MTATFIDIAIRISGGILATLIGFRYLGPKPGENERFDSLHKRWLRHLKWLGPLSILIFGLSAIATSVGGSYVANSGASTARKVEAMQNAVSNEGKLAERDTFIDSPEGFRILVPNGYTYSKPLGSSISLLALFDAKGEAMPVLSVFVTKLDGQLDGAFETVKSSMISRNSTTNFSETTVSHAKQSQMLRVNFVSRENGVDIKGGMAFFANQGRLFGLTYGARVERFGMNEALFERVVASFEPI